jgi:nitronate monooxygenase
VKEWTFERFQGLLSSLKFRLPSIDMPRLTIGSKHVEMPIVQGGMGVAVSLSSLSSAVSNQGGIGVIAANGIGMIERDYFKDGRAANIRALRSEIRKARANTSGPIGVNIMVALEDFHQLLDAAIEEKADIIFMGAGLPIKNLPVTKMREADVQAVPIVSSARAANLIFSMWKRIYNDVPDAVVVEGPKAGGHLGVPEKELDDEAYALETVIPQVKDLISTYESDFGKTIPVIAAGGIFTGTDIFEIMKLGADAVQMGTRFAATEECDADIRFKQAIVDASAEDIGIIKSPVGLPGRAIINTFLTSTTAEKRNFTCPWQCLAGCRAEESNYCISVALNNARKGNLNSGFVFVGTNAYRVASIQSVASLMKELAQEYAAAVFAERPKIFSDAADMIERLKQEYQSAEKRVRELKETYATAVMNERIESLKQEIAKANARLGSLQKTMSEKLNDTYSRALNGLSTH